MRQIYAYPKKRIGVILFSIVASIVFLLGAIGLDNAQVFASSFHRENGGSSEFEFEHIPIESIEIAHEGALSLFPGQSTELSVRLVPSFAIATVRNLEYRIVRGGNFAVIDGAVLTVFSDAPVGERIEVRAMVDGELSDNTLVFTVAEIMPDRIEFLNIESSVRQGGVLPLNAILYPENVANRRIIFDVAGDGREFAYVIAGTSTLVVNNNLPAGDLSVTVRATSARDAAIFADKTFELYVPVQEIRVSGVDITEVEQQRSYNFLELVRIYPLTATHGLEFSIDESARDYAEICSEDGILEVLGNAPIGTQITIIISEPGGVSATHTVSVVAVYATEWTVSKISPADLDARGFLPGNVFDFDVRFGEPFNITQANKVYSIEIVGAHPNVARVEGSRVIINDVNQITVRNPQFTIRVSSEQNSALITQYFDIEVFIPVDTVVLNNMEHSLRENTIYCINNVIKTSVYPFNHSATIITYEVLDGNGKQYVRISDAGIEISNYVSAGNLTFRVVAIIDGIESDPIAFSIFVPVRSVTLEVDNNRPISTKEIGEVITFTAFSNPEATNQTPVFRVVNGAGLLTAVDRPYATGVFSDGSIIPAQVRVRANLTAEDVATLNRQIAVVAEIEGHSAVLTDILVYIPMEKMVVRMLDTASNNTVNRGETAFAIDINNHVTTPSWEVTSIRVAGIRVYSGVYVHAGRGVIEIPHHLTAGAEILIEFRSLPEFGESRNFDVTLVVAPLDTSVFSVNFGRDSVGVEIDRNNPQLWVGRYINVDTRIGANELSVYGARFEVVYYHMPSSVATLNNVGVLPRIYINPNAPSGYTIQFRVVVIDGHVRIPLPIQTITTFAPVDFEGVGLNFVTTNLIRSMDSIEVGYQVKILGAGDLEDRVVWTDNQGGYALTNDRRISSRASTQNLVITVSLIGMQRYNGRLIEALDASIVQSKMFYFTGVEYRDRLSNGDSVIVRRFWKPRIDGVETRMGIISPLLTSQQLVAPREGYAHTQWMSENGVPFRFDSVYTGDDNLVLYAHWSALDQRITLRNQNITVRERVTDEWQRITLELELLRAVGYSWVWHNWNIVGQSNHQNAVLGRWLDLARDINAGVRYSYAITRSYLNNPHLIQGFGEFFIIDINRMIQGGAYIRGNYHEADRYTWTTGALWWVETHHAHVVLHESTLLLRVRQFHLFQ